MKEKQEKTENIKFPDGFFSEVRPEVTWEETLKDVTPIEWDFSKKSDDVVVYSAKEKANE